MFTRTGLGDVYICADRKLPAPSSVLPVIRIENVFVLLLLELKYNYKLQRRVEYLRTQSHCQTAQKMVKLTPELIEQAAQYTNPVRDRELDLRGMQTAHVKMVLRNEICGIMQYCIFQLVYLSTSTHKIDLLYVNNQPLMFKYLNILGIRLFILNFMIKFV